MLIVDILFLVHERLDCAELDQKIYVICNFLI